LPTNDVQDIPIDDVTAYSNGHGYPPPAFPDWFWEENEGGEHGMTHLSSPSETPENGVLTPSHFFSEVYGGTLVVQEPHAIPVGVPQSTQHEGGFSSHGFWARARQAHEASDAVFWSHLLSTDHVGEHSSLNMGFSPENNNSCNHTIGVASTVPHGGSHPWCSKLSLGNPGSALAEQAMLPNWNHGSEKTRRQGKVVTSRSTSARSEIVQKHFRSFDNTVNRSPGLRTITPTQSVHKSVCEETEVVVAGAVSNRVAHNIVEKQYRIRLNEHFEKLLESIPADDIRSVSSTRRPDGSERKVSKCEVLRLAKRRIGLLEEEIKRLEDMNQIAEED
jgi:hypothetical protein